MRIDDLEQMRKGVGGDDVCLAVSLPFDDAVSLSRMETGQYFSAVGNPLYWALVSVSGKAFAGSSRLDGEWGLSDHLQYVDKVWVWGRDFHEQLFDHYYPGSYIPPDLSDGVDAARVEWPGLDRYTMRTVAHRQCGFQFEQPLQGKSLRPWTEYSQEARQELAMMTIEKAAAIASVIRTIDP